MNDRQILIELFGENYDHDISLKENIEGVFKINKDLKIENMEIQNNLKTARDDVARIAKRYRVVKYGAFGLVIITVFALIVK